LHWLAEQALAWSGLPVITMRPTVFLEGLFLTVVAAGVRDSDALVLSLGSGRTSPISAVDVARAVAVVLDDPAPHIGRICNLTGYESADLTHYAKVFSETLGRTITYRDVPTRCLDQQVAHGRSAGASAGPPRRDGSPAPARPLRPPDGRLHAADWARADQHAGIRAGARHRVHESRRCCLNATSQPPTT
jgi:hypothetical protein